tara:strand:+ start:609 stop:1010 length:402 start_codon:yes stop_codon:yes gene_type:complete
MIAAPRYSALLTYGAFDAMSPADTAVLRHLSSLARDLIVGCATDALCARMGMSVTMPFSQRRALLSHNRYVSHVIAQDCWDQLRTDIVNYNVSTLAVAAAPSAKLDALQDIAQVLYLPHQGPAQTQGAIALVS